MPSFDLRRDMTDVGPSAKRDAPAIVFGLEPPPKSGSRQFNIPIIDYVPRKNQLSSPKR